MRLTTPVVQKIDTPILVYKTLIKKFFPTFNAEKCL